MMWTSSRLVEPSIEMLINRMFWTKLEVFHQLYILASYPASFTQFFNWVKEERRLGKGGKEAGYEASIYDLGQKRSVPGILNSANLLPVCQLWASIHNTIYYTQKCATDGTLSRYQVMVITTASAVPQSSNCRAHLSLATLDSNCSYDLLLTVVDPNTCILNIPFYQVNEVTLN